MTHGYKTKRKKVEVLTANYPIAVNLDKQAKTEQVNEDEEA
jgi:hypothetical protein